LVHNAGMTNKWHCLLISLWALTAGPVASAQSTCFGTPALGRLEGGVTLPLSGPNYSAYGTVPVLAGRTHMHHKVRDAVIRAYALLEKQAPGVRFVYAESGWKNGGPFKPHKTHQNGLSIDLMVPVRDDTGASVPMPTHAFNRYGYDMEFDRQGRAENLRIDFDALGALILALEQAAHEEGIAVRRVIFAPDLQAQLYGSRLGARVRQHVTIPTTRSWIRHDEHIHVDFAVPCQAFGIE
jgi:penicillin-insensitive murein endopeptidase